MKRVRHLSRGCLQAIWLSKHVVICHVNKDRNSEISRNTIELKQYGTCNCAKVNTTAYCKIKMNAIYEIQKARV